MCQLFYEIKAYIYQKPGAFLLGKGEDRGTISLSNYETNIIDTNQLLFTFMKQTFYSVGMLCFLDLL